MKRQLRIGATAALFALGLMLAVFVAGSAAAKSPKKKATTAAAKTTTASLPSYTDTTSTTESPGDSFFVINGTVNAASDHEIVGSSAFPNFTTGAVDNYYSMAHAHVDNSPFAEGTASPADTGPIGQTAAAGNFQQPQYADARWPGSPDKATYGTQGQPYAEATAGDYHATADASEATNGLSGPGLGGSRTLAVPKGFDGRLRQALAAWKSKWPGRLSPKKGPPTISTPAGTVTVPRPGLEVPKPKVTVPPATVTTPLGTVTTPAPQPALGGGASPVPPVSVPSTTLPTAGAMPSSRSLVSLRKPQPSSASPSGDGESLLTSSTRADLVPEAGAPKPGTCPAATPAIGATATGTAKSGKGKGHTPKTKATTSTATGTTPAAPCKAYALVMSGESSLGRVSLGGGQIVIEGIHVTASITNDGTPSYKAAVSVASATIGGVPVTIDQDGVHIAGQVQGLPYQQASDALNGALKQAGIQLFLVSPEVATSSCGQTGAGGGTTGTGGGTTTPSPGDQSSSCDQTGMSGMCGQTGSSSNTGSSSGPGTAPGLPAGTTPSSSGQTDTTDTTSSCDQTGMTGTCDQSGTGSSGGTGGGGVPAIGTTTTTTTTTKGQTDTTDTTSSCDQTGMTSTTPSSCSAASTTTGTSPTSTDQTETTGMDTTSTDATGMGSPSDQLGAGGGSSSSGEETVTATGVHVVFTQPVNQSGVPAQYVEHILGEVYVDSLAVPGGPLAGLGLSTSPFSSSASSSSCPGGRLRGGASGTSAAGGGGGSSVGASGSPSSLSPSGAAFGSSSQPNGGTAGSSLPAAFAAALKKPLWLLLAYIVWQALVIGTGWSLWNWRRGGAT